MDWCSGEILDAKDCIIGKQTEIMGPCKRHSRILVMTDYARKVDDDHVPAEKRRKGGQNEDTDAEDSYCGG